jgi:hypothetical protein
VLSAERVEVSARSSNSTVGSGGFEGKPDPGVDHPLEDGLDGLPADGWLIGWVGEDGVRVVEAATPAPSPALSRSTTSRVTSSGCVA